MRYIFASHDRSEQVRRIREGIERHREEGRSDPDSLEMHPVYDDILEQLGRHFLGYWGDRVAVAALGGYGRMEMSPYSDIDLLFLRPDDAPEGVYRAIRAILHLLWDAKVELGHSVRTIDECSEEATKDLAVLTSLLDARFVWGDDRIFGRLIIDRERMLLERDPLEVYLSVEAEIAGSTEEFGRTIYLLEPYVKEGPGSLRYLQLIAWLTRILYGTGEPADLSIIGVCSEKEAETAEKGLRFLAGVRTRLHYLAGRRDDRLRFEAQAVLAEQMGFRDTPERRAVESFMREYYRHATTNEFFGRSVLARARLFLRPSKHGSQFKRLKLDDAFYIGAGGINRFDSDEESLNAWEMLDAFRMTARTGCGLDVRLADMIRTRLRTMDDLWRDDPAVSAVFLDIFRKPGSVGKALAAMMETGFLEYFVPEFKPVRYLRLHDAYHQYTVDRHTMAVLSTLDSFSRAGKDKEERLIRTVFSRLETPEVLYLAALFHDVGKGRGPGHEKRGEKIARPVLQRVGLPEERIEDVCFLIRNHLAMSHLAFKKDLHDERLLGRFAESLMGKRMLDMLMLLTHADLIAVGPRGLNSWRRLLLEELYYRTLDVIEGESAEGEDLADWIRQIKAVVKTHVPPKLRGPELDVFLAVAPSRYLLDFYPGIVADHFVYFRNYLEEHGRNSLGPDDIIVTKEDHRRPGYSAITLIGRDRHGLFFRLAGSLAANGINILSAWSHTIGNEMIVATFHVNDVPQGPLTDPNRWDKFRSDVRRVIAGEIDVHELVAARRGSRKPRPGTPTALPPLKVEIDNAASDAATVVEVYARDRPGLLYDITRQLSSLELSIILTKISTEVDQAADIFYVVDENGEKIVDFDRLDEIRDRLRKHLEAIEEELLNERRGSSSRPAVNAADR
jgi:[protein-PII] uridylyltransferase